MAKFALLAFLVMPVWAAEAVVPGIPRFHQVDEHVYRGGQPAATSWNALAALGVTTVIDLRAPGKRSRQEAEAVEAAGMRYFNVPFAALAAPRDEQIAQVLELLESGGGVFLHCERGADRTGTVIACYRIAHDHWDNQKALAEAVLYGMSSFEFGMRRYILQYSARAQ